LLSRHIRPQRGRFSLLVVLLFTSIGLQLINPQILRSFIDTALGGGELRALTLAATAFVVIALVQQVVGISVNYLGQSVAWTATNALRLELAEHSLGLDMSFHNAHTPGELIERIDGDVAAMADFFAQFVITLIGNLALLVGILIAIFIEDWRAGLGFAGFAAVSLVLLGRMRDIAMPEEKARRKGEAEMYGFIEEQLSGTEDIRANGAVPFSLRKLGILQAVIFKANYRAHYKEWLIHIVMGISLLAGNLIALGSGYWLYQLGAITLGTVYLFVHYMNMLEMPIYSLTREMEAFQMIGACVERLSELRQVRPSVTEGDLAQLPAAPAPAQIHGYAQNASLLAASLAPASPGGNGHRGASAPQGLRLAFEHVTFAYADGAGEAVLEDLSFALPPGRVLGLLGRTGSGKTTLTRLLLRLFDPTQGAVTLNGVDLRRLTYAALRREVAIVTQEVQLFRASVRDNLAFFDASIADERILAAIQELELGDWYTALPEGLDTLLEEGGAGLSAGEAQLLAFTRILLRSPGLVILDEASSRLDPHTERRIERAITRLIQGRTAIVIAHRLSTVQRADEILILENGRLLEHGERLKLASNPDSRFASLLQTGLEEVLV
jgi:ABC-type multidrug transport system fused ATPase/permease subunit